MRLCVSFLFALVLVASAGCAEQAPLAGASCPCSEGWTCCPSNVCVAAGNVCPVEDSAFLDFTTEGQMALLGVDRGACAGTRVSTVQYPQSAAWTIQASPGRAEVSYNDSLARQLYEFTPTGQLARVSDYFAGGGTQETREYLLDGRLATVTRDGNRSDYHYFQDNRATIDTRQCCSDDSVDVHRTLFRDAHNHVLVDETDEKMGENGVLDGIPDTVFVSTYGAHGLVEQHLSGTNLVDTVVTYSYDEDGRSIGATIDHNEDGSADAFMTKAWDDAGRLVRRDYRFIEDDGSMGTISYAYQYDCP